MSSSGGGGQSGNSDGYSGDPAVDRYWANLDHPLAAQALLLREALLKAAPGVVESIKWKAPNYALADDFATFSLRRPNAVQVILHTGAKPKPEHPEIVVDAPAKLLRWADRNRAIATFTSADDVAEHLPAFTSIVTSWASQLV